MWGGEGGEGKRLLLLSCGGYEKRLRGTKIIASRRLILGNEKAGITVTLIQKAEVWNGTGRRRRTETLVMSLLSKCGQCRGPPKRAYSYDSPTFKKSGTAEKQNS